MFSRLRKRLQSWLIDPVVYTLAGFLPWLSDREFDFYEPLDIGRVGGNQPEGYRNYRADRGHLSREAGASKRFFLIGKEGCWGLRWGYGPMRFEKYVSDAEPEIDPGGLRRTIIWQPMTRLDVPAGWRRSRFVMNVRLSGFAEIGAPDNYWKSWTSHAQRHRKKWLAQAGEWEIVPIEDHTFLVAFRYAQMDGVLKSLFTGLFRESRKSQGEHMTVIGMRRKSTGAIEAGFACVDVPESRQSIHLVSFLHGTARDSSIGTGMMDWWFQHGIKKGLRFLDFDRFWAPGEPSSWKGFSRFKSQFGIRFVRWPYPLVKKVGNWQFMSKNIDKL